ncbi:MAG: aminodeoxychorismate synthase component I [Candidatus Pacebacteria bacterium]|nr:aminodeoxychorismate synthase component I [Candidatus Paceibacterota bacterium]
MATLVIDHYDSFTWNLVDLIATVNGETPRVVQHDQIEWEEIRDMGVENIILSPGPGSPLNLGDFKVSRQVLDYSRLPILGVCLGHQGIAAHFGAKLYQTPDPRHGRSSLIEHDGREIFKVLTHPLEVIRYHSLAVAEPLPAELEVTARIIDKNAPNQDQMIMALRHRHRPIWGVQFHPESILSQGGAQIMANFRDLSRQHSPRSLSFGGFNPSPIPPEPAKSATAATRRAIWQRIDLVADGEAAFLALFADSPLGFWLDSGLSDQGRWSFMGCGDSFLALDSDPAVFTAITAAVAGGIESPPPIPFCGGLVGWLGYEAAADSARKAKSDGEPALAAIPTCGFLLVNRLVAIDHRSGCAYGLVVTEAEASDQVIQQARLWIDSVVATLADMPPPEPPQPFVAMANRPPQVIQFKLAHSRSDYYKAVEKARQWIAEGEAYQLCLTTRITVDNPGVEPLDLYRILRRRNPAPHAAFLRFPCGAIISSSPERFLSANAKGRLEARPIKGTARRDPDPARDQQIAFALAASEKDRAENLMIVDLLRNDLTQVAVVGSVAVPSLIAVESFATVHQLVSTITAELRGDCSPIDAIAAAFPGGSMTGAPKKRAMELLTEIEKGPRGVYSGGLGWIGYDGAFDLAIVIRTIIAAGGKFSVGVGGGIVAQSTTEGEFSEMLLKSKALIGAIEVAINGQASDRPVIIGSE